MAIIPQQSWFTQVGIQNQSKLTQSGTELGYSFEFLPEDYPVSETQKQALRLHYIGLNVFPLPFGQKSGYPWKRMQYTRLNPSNSASGVLPAFAGRCNVGIICGRTSANLFVIDCEEPQTFFAHLKALEERKIPRWAVVTARGGHIYLRCREGETDNIPTGRLPHAEIRGKNSYVLAPPSIHPSGTAYRWLVQEGPEPPAVSVRDIDWLRDKEGKRVHLSATPNRYTYKTTWQRGVVSPCSHLSKATQDYLQNGHLITEGSRNRRLFSAACDLLGNQYSSDEVEDLLMPIAIGSGLNQREIIQTLESAWSKTRTPARRTPPQRSTAAAAPRKKFWRQALLFASHYTWVGRTSGNQRALFVAFIERARLGCNENGTFRASLRELAELSRMSVNAVRRNLHGLTAEKKLVRKVGEDRMSGASLWQFMPSVLSYNITDEEPPQHWLRYAESLFQSDASERGAAGKTGMFLYRFMTVKKTPLMPSQLARLSGLTINQVNYALWQLKKLGLVQRVSTGWAITGDHSDEKLSKISGKQGIGMARRRRHQQERERFVGDLLIAVRMRVEGNKYMKAEVEHAAEENRPHQPRSNVASDDADTDDRIIQEDEEPLPTYNFTPENCPAELAGLPAELLADPLICDAILLGGVIQWDDPES